MSIPIDFIEDFIAIMYATGSDKNKADNDNVCPVCGTEMEENDNGELYCLECGE